MVDMKNTDVKDAFLQAKEEIRRTLSEFNEKTGLYINGDIELNVIYSERENHGVTKLNLNVKLVE